MLDWLSVVLTESSPADLLRLLAVPVFGWAAYRDVRTRRVPNRTWLPLAALGVAVLVWEGWRVSNGDAAGIFDALDRERYFLRVALSLGMVGSLGYLFYWFGGFGGADAKALIVLAVLFPTFPTYIFPETTLPLTRSAVGVFSLTILSNTVLAGAIYPLAIAARNALTGHVGKAMLIGKPVSVDDVPETYGSLLQTPEGFTRRGLDLDALRMYLQWRGCTLADLRADPGRFRDPASLPADPNPPGDGSIPVDTDSEAESDPGGGSDAEAGSQPDGESDPATDGGTDEVREPDGPAESSAETGDDTPDEPEVEASDAPDAVDDPWGAAAFLDDIEGDAYATTPEGLRDGLAVLTSEDVVWVTPGLPFIVPMFAGLLVSLVYGDVFVELFSLVA